MNGIVSIFKIRVRLKTIFVLFVYIFTTVICEFHNHRKYDQIDHISFNLENYSTTLNRQGSFSLFNETIKNDYNNTKKRRHHRHSKINVKSRDSHRKRNANSIKSDAKRDYVSAIVGKDVQLDCKITESVHDDDKVKNLNYF